MLGQAFKITKLGPVGLFVEDLSPLGGLFH